MNFRVRDAFPRVSTRRGVHYGEPLTPEQMAWEAARLKAKVAEEKIRTETVHEFFAGLSDAKRASMLLEFLYEQYDKGHGPFWSPDDDLD